MTSDDEEAEQNDGVASGQGNQIAYWPCSSRTPGTINIFDIIMFLLVNFI